MLDGTVKNIIKKTGLSEEEALNILTKNNPQGKIIEPEEVAATTLWLCSDEAHSITGQSIMVAGGEIM
jgi:NAD(P)-dependent dehydrogenase (short-subunit alcohol dehydrogenase family)